MSSLLTDLSVKCETQAMDILALRKQVFELEDENAELRELATEFYSGLVNMGHCLGVFHKCTNRACRNTDINARCCRLQLALLKAERMGIEVDG